MRILILLGAVLPACGVRQPPPDLAFEAVVPAGPGAEVTGPEVRPGPVPLEVRPAAEPPEVRTPTVAPVGPGPTLGALLGPGSSADRVKEVLGKAERVLTRDEEKKAWEAFGYQESREMPFFLGFDEVWEYGPRSNHSRLPVWKVYLKDGAAVLINLSSYIYPEARGSLWPDFGSSRPEVEKVLGKASLSYIDEGGTESLCYHRLGVHVLLTSPVSAGKDTGPPRKATNFLLYRPLSQAEFRRLAELLRKS